MMHVIKLNHLDNKHMLKKILIVSENFYPEEFKINELAVAWKKKGYEVTVLTQIPTYPFGQVFSNYQNKYYSKEIYNGITIYRVKAIIGYKTSLLKKLLKYLTFMFMGTIISLTIGRKYDYIFGFNVGALTSMVPAIVLSQFYKKPVTLWIQDIWPDSVYAYGFKKNKFLEFCLNNFVKYIYKYTTNFAIAAKGFEKRIIPYLSKKKDIKYCPNWADFLNKDLDSFQFSQENKIHFTFAGNLGTVQNLENIITAFGTLENKYFDRSQLNLIGDGSFVNELKKIVEKNKFENIIFWGKKPREEIYKYLKASDFLILSLIDKPIFSLTVPSKTQTYIAAEKPILAIIKGETLNLIHENNLGLSAEPNDIEQIRNVFMKAIMLDMLQKEKFTQRCEYLTTNLFNKEVIIKNLLLITTQG